MSKKEKDPKPDGIFVPFEELEDVRELTEEQREELKRSSLERRERVRKYNEANPRAKKRRDEFVKNFYNRETPKPKSTLNISDKNENPNPNFTLNMSGNHVDDTQKLVNDLQSQFPDDYIKRLYGMLLDLRAMREEMLQKSELCVAERQDMRNLKYDVEIIVEAFKVFLKNPKITEELIFPEDKV